VFRRPLACCASSSERDHGCRLANETLLATFRTAVGLISTSTPPTGKSSTLSTSGVSGATHLATRESTTYTTAPVDPIAQQHLVHQQQRVLPTTLTTAPAESTTLTSPATTSNAPAKTREAKTQTTHTTTEPTSTGATSTASVVATARLDIRTLSNSRTRIRPSVDEEVRYALIPLYSLAVGYCFQGYCGNR
jgi:hypothetical protein